MYVIMDLEWFIGENHHIYPTQIAALRIDKNWNTVSLFSELISPRKGISVPWSHFAFSGASADSFVRAPSAYTVLKRLSEWLESDDVLCWWDEASSATLKRLLRAILKYECPNETRILKPYFEAFAHDGKSIKGDLYALVCKRAIILSKEKHCSVSDVIAIQRLMRSAKISTRVLREPAPEKHSNPRPNGIEYPFWYDASSNLLHASGSSCAESLQDLKGVRTVKGCISKKCTPCPECCTEIWKQAVMDYNAEIVRQRRCAYFYFADSKVFHRGTCHFILSANRHFDSAVYYDTCIAAGRVPCRSCRPVPGLFAGRTQQQETPNQWMNKQERRALDRYEQAIRERKDAASENLSDVQRRDMLTLSSPNYAFWAAYGYRNFHLRSCRKLNSLTNLKGFESYQRAVKAGYLPCRECRPSSKQNLDISMQAHTRERKDETVEVVLELCGELELEYRYRDPVLCIRTPIAEWEINVSMHPVVIEHKPAGSNAFHQQHKMFMSLSDAVHYIARHDGVKNQFLNGMLMSVRHED